jgi:antitoxin CptB
MVTAPPLMVTTPPRIDPRELGKLRWRCRRGMKELDLLLLRYVEEQFCGASTAHQEAFRSLLDDPDTVIHAYCLGQERPPTALLTALIERITEGASDDR